MEVFIKSEEILEKFAKKLAFFLTSGVIFLDGNLGAGKTTLVRYILKALNENSRVKSPTYTLVESYKLSKFDLHHFDLYRLADAQELEFLGIRDYDSENSLLIFEWWTKGEGFLPKPDLIIKITINKDLSRNLILETFTEKGKNWTLNL